MDRIDLAIYCGDLRGETAKAVSIVAHHGVMDKITWTDLQRNRSAEVEHADILVAVVGGDYRDGMTTAEVHRAIVDGEADIGDYGVMLREYLAVADKIADALKPYVDKAAAGDAAARHVLAALRKRHVWARICEAADSPHVSRLSCDLYDLYAEGLYNN